MICPPFRYLKIIAILKSINSTFREEPWSDNTIEGEVRGAVTRKVF